MNLVTTYCDLFTGGPRRGLTLLKLWLGQPMTTDLLPFA